MFTIPVQWQIYLHKEDKDAKPFTKQITNQVFVKMVNAMQWEWTLTENDRYLPMNRI